ncbi:sugar phosphate isomerase/epimerase family protein [Aggregatilinea lenta]|uniref:sugar phosphate isomerase/epimerase family protein n=1 Tax=Aggregatilinea lenta TaxID=913108 RepID=UPI000E5A6EDF|nr:sugar phosphate isomerase/epimerase family protein [Aggregatilinea lenta]
MKFGVNSWIWVSPLTTRDVAELAPLAKSLGAEWFEVPLEDPGLIDAAEAGAIIRDLGMGTSVCAAMGPDRDLIHEDAAIRDNGMAYLMQCVDAVQRLGGTNVAGPLYSSVGRVWQSTADERRRDTDLLVQQLRELAEYAGGHGAVLCVEPLNRFETSFINLAAQAIEVVDRVDHPACKIMLDTFHMNIEEQAMGDAFRAVGPRLQHVHACENDRSAPGSGHVPWDDVATAIKEIGYDGPVVIESFTAQVKSIARAAAIWRPLAESQDALARDGLRFLKQLLG